MSPFRPLRVAIIGTNDPRNFSGGRYHALIMAYALSAAGCDAHLITDHVPAFNVDLEPLAPAGITIHRTRDFGDVLPDGQFDWVFVVPTGIFLPDFYEACLEFAARAGARIGLVNFESANWFNALAPEPRDPRLWDYWRRIGNNGGLILSSARVSDAWARTFYHAPEGRLRFEVWCPPINSVAAQRFDGLEKDGSILVFVRPQDVHKGSGLLTQIDPALYAGRTLRLVSGRDVPADFQETMRTHLAKADNARLEILLRISDVHKFRLLTSAQTVLFPTRFEGFGYPPVEAAYAGTESACFDLPVLRETVGKTAHFAPTADLAGFETAMAAALAAPERRAELRATVFSIADFGEAAHRLLDILLRSADPVLPLAPRLFRVAVGPFARADPHPPGEAHRSADLPTFPPYVVSAVRTTAGEVLITGRAMLPAGVDQLEAVTAAGERLPLTWDLGPVDAVGFRDVRFYLAAPQEIERHRIAVNCLGPDIDPVILDFQIDRVAPANELRPVKAGISENAAQGDHRRIRGWVLAREPVTTLCYTPDGKSWYRFTVNGERRDVIANNPGYASPRCEFSELVPASAEPNSADARLICLAGEPGKERAIDLLVGWSPAPKKLFATAIGMGEAITHYSQPAVPAVRAAKPAPVPRREAGAAPIVQAPRRPKLGTLEIINHSDQNWAGGIASRIERGRLGAVIVRRNDLFEKLVSGATLRFASGAARVVTAIEAKNDSVTVTLDGPVNPAGNAFPNKVELFDAAWSASSYSTFTLGSWSDKRWWRSVWNNRDHRHRRGFNLKTDLCEKLGIATGAQLQFAASRLRTVIEHDDDGFNNRRIWLNDVIRPLTDGAPNLVTILAGTRSETGGIRFSLAREDRGWIGGVLTRGDSVNVGETVLLEVAAAEHVRRGGLLRFAGEHVLRVVSATLRGDGLEVVVDGRLDARIHGHPATTFLVDEVDAPAGVTSPYAYPDPGLEGKDPLHLVLSTHARRRGNAIRAASPVRPAKPRALVLSPVAPFPANQGNRVVTRNLIRHLVDRGFECDVIVQNWVDTAESAPEFGPDVRLITVPYPAWDATDAARRRRAIAESMATLQDNALDAQLARDIEQAAEYYHPYFIVRDETVDIARMLYAQYEYAAIVCNYTHMIRVPVELAALRPLPPVAVITHDALSRLPREFAGKKLDLMYRACPPFLEREVLDAVPGAAVVAISRSEADYFRTIGVQNPIVLTEYDAAEEMAPFRVPASAFDRRTIIFHGSANPMNLAGLNWFVDECWSAVLEAVPDAKLVVCGRAGSSWDPQLPNIELVGELPRDAMLKLCSAASIAINPCVAGTGLKIKTVETACLGLPAVCLPTAVDGLEDVAGSFAIVAEDGPSFAKGCITLLTDPAQWAQLRNGAIATADARFAQAAVYGALDELMGWTEPQVAAPAVTIAAEPTLVDVSDPVKRLKTHPSDEAALLTLGKQLVRAGQHEVGWEMINRVATARRGDFLVALQAAQLALEIGYFSQAIGHAANAIAQRPSLGEGYVLMGRALIGTRQPHDAAEALLQGILTAPYNSRVLTALEEALILAKRDAEAEFWAGRRISAAYGQYMSFHDVQWRGLVRGFGIDREGALTLDDAKGSMLLCLPSESAERIVVAVDILRPKALTDDTEVVLSLKDREIKAIVRAAGPRVQTLAITADLDCAEDNGIVLLGLAFEGGRPAGGSFRVIGCLLSQAGE